MIKYIKRDIYGREQIIADKRGRARIKGERGVPALTDQEEADIRLQIGQEGRIQDSGERDR